MLLVLGQCNEASGRVKNRKVVSVLLLGLNRPDWLMMAWTYDDGGDVARREDWGWFSLRAVKIATVASWRKDVYTSEDRHY